MMKHLVMATTVAAAALVAAAPAAAQRAPVPADTSARAQVEQIVLRSGVREALDEVASTAAPELERALEQLSASVNAVATRIAQDPELRASAARAAHGLVGVAETVVVEHTSVLQEMLRAAADRLEEIARPKDTTRRQ